MTPASTNNLIGLLFRPQFVTFSISVIFSQIASNMLNIVLIILTYNLTHSNFAVSVLVMAFLLPQVFFSFLGGIIADAKNKRKILIFGNVARALILVAFFFVKDTLAFIYILVFVVSVITQFYIPAEAPIFGICLFGSILVGYVAAGPAMRFFGSSGVFIFMAALFAVAYLCVQIMPDVTPSVRKLRTEKTMVANGLHLYRLVWKELRDVIKILNEKKNVASSLVFLALSQVIILLLATIVPDYAQKTLRVPAEDISIVIFAPAVGGMLIASLVIGSKFTKVRREKIIAVGMFLSSIVLFLFGTIDLQKYINLIILSVGVTLLAGIANACIFIPAQTIVQTHVSHKSLSKVYGLLFLAVGIIAFVPIILTGVFADVLGVRAVLLGLGVLLLLVGIAQIFFFNKGRNLLLKIAEKNI